jgi:hypothetical protein
LLDEFHVYLSTLASPSSFSGVELRKVMVAFQEPFESHFRSEITTIANLADHPKAPAAGSKEEKTAAEELDSWGRGSVMRAGITDVGLFFLYNTDRYYEDGIWTKWPDIPGPLKWVLINVGGFYHSGWWKFASCDSHGRRRNLHALPTYSEVS